MRANREPLPLEPRFPLAVISAILGMGIVGAAIGPDVVGGSPGRRPSRSHGQSAPLHRGSLRAPREASSTGLASRSRLPSGTAVPCAATTRIRPWRRSLATRILPSGRPAWRRLWTNIFAACKAILRAPSGGTSCSTERHRPDLTFDSALTSDSKLEPMNSSGRPRVPPSCWTLAPGRSC